MHFIACATRKSMQYVDPYHSHVNCSKFILQDVKYVLGWNDNLFINASK